jgi:crotonobetainyl-CoA:carnitine CoA-transferase CaiB-like acyl-CoA transferase
MTAQRLEDLMEEFGIPSGKIYRAPEMLADPQFKAREAIVSTPHPKFGELRMQNVAPKLSLTPGTIRSPSPELGEHNREVYREILGYSDERIAELQAAGII